MREWMLGAVLLIASPAQALYSGFDAGTAARENPASDGRNGHVPSVNALALGPRRAIDVDGRLDDTAWREADSAGGFRIWDPDRGALPSEETVFKVAYDEDAIYFAVACLEKDPASISKTLSRRDSYSNTDMVSIYIDPYHDRTTGYNFRVNPLGVQQDAYVYNDGDRDTDWDAVWHAETSQDDDGWYAEVRVPFSSIRYRQDSPTWGLQVYRYMHGRGEDTAWVTWDREQAGFVSRFGTVRGLAGIPAPRQLEVMPYAVARTTDPSEEGPEELDNFENFGMDLKYGVTADLTLNATVQPDFGQVEADPAQLNLTPYETFFQEKRPFFVEGSRFFEHPEFRMFYSRRIGTGDKNSRIRYAAKLTGKTVGDVSVAALAAATDITRDGQSHNCFKGGDCSSQYLVGRVGKEFNQGNHHVNLMQTAVFNGASRDDFGDRASREAYTTGLDFDLRFRERSWIVSGSAVGSVIDPEPLASDPDFRPEKSYGTGGELGLAKLGGKFRGSCWGRWETGTLDLNDIGFLSAPDELNAGVWMQYNYTPDGESKLLNRTNVNFNWNKGWVYEPRAGYDLHSEEKVWSYDRWHRQMGGGNFNGWMQWRNFWESWWGIAYNPEGSQRHYTGDWVTMENGDVEAIPGGGPLISEPTTWGGWFGFNTDSRKNLVLDWNINHYNDTAHNVSLSTSIGMDWNQSSAVHHRISASYSSSIDDTQHMENYENPGKGIGGVSFVFGDLMRRTFDLTLRTSLLFSRNQSLEVYAQPYLTTGDYRRARELVRADTYDLETYTAEGFDYDAWDFTYSAVNLNVVYRWEYRPGSTFYLVWTHSRSSYEDRGSGDNRSAFDHSLDPHDLFENEPENIFLAKFSYWIPI